MSSTRIKKTPRVTNWIQKQESTISFLKKAYFISKDSHRVKYMFSYVLVCCQQVKDEKKLKYLL